MNVHSFEEHTSEVRLRIEADDLAGLFAESALGLAELLTDAPLRPAAGEREEELVVQAPDREALLVEWLNELIFRSETRKKVYGEVAILRASDTEVAAVARGAEPEQIKTAVKAATFHGLRVTEQGGRWSATIVLDV